MLFTSYAFLLVFLPMAVGVYWLLPATGGVRRAWLLFSSAVFYGAASLAWLLLLGGMTAATCAATRYAMAAPRPGWRRLGLAVVFGNLVVLALFKYAGAVPASTGAPLLRLALPVGLSFYTFNLIGYGLDVYRRRTPPAETLFDLATYTTFFPTLTSGPLMRWADFRGQIERTHLTRADLESAVFSLTMGLGKKLLVADWLAAVVDPLWPAPSALGFWGAWMALLGYHFRIYFDFSGYSDIAMGLGLLLGVRIPANFKAPYTARTPAEFWQRWHVSLSEWFRDQLFFPLSRILLRHGGSRHPDVTRAVSLITTMTLVGLWHGPSAGMVAWGAYHGVLLVLGAQAFSGVPRIASGAWSRLATMLAVLMGWVLFRSESLGAARGFYSALLGGQGWGPASLPGVDAAFAVLIVVLVVVTSVPRDTVDLGPRRRALYATALAMLLMLALLRIEQPTPFLYFQF